MGEQEELEALRRAVALMRPLVAKMAEMAGLAGQVLMPPDELARALGWEIPEPPIWEFVAGMREWLAPLAHGVCVSVTQHGSPGVDRCHFGWRVIMIEDERDVVFASGEAGDLIGAKLAALKAAEGVGVALVAKARVGLKALGGDDEP